MKTWQLMLIGWLIMAIVMTLLWFWQKRKSNAGIVDVAWSFGTAGICALFAYGASGDVSRRILIATLAGIWGLRLGFHLLHRVTTETEDGRYASLRSRWGDKAQPYFFIFFQVQAAWTLLFAFPLLIAANNAAMFPIWSDFVGIGIWIISVTGESIADMQLARFRSNPSNKGQVCQVGLWAYSRHPNYFFEWIHWFAYIFLGLYAPYAWLTLFGPIVMLLFLFKVTGIPYTEMRALQTRGEKYREYQRTTSVFILWPRKQKEA